MIENLLMTALTTPLSNMDETNCWENRPFAAVWPRNQPELTNSKVREVTKTIKKKKRVRTYFTTEQLRSLENAFMSSHYITVESRRVLATQLNMSEKCVKIWFQNRRQKHKRDSETATTSEEDSIDNCSNVSLASTTNEQAISDDNVSVQNGLQEYDGTDVWDSQQRLSDTDVTAQALDYSSTAQVLGNNQLHSVNTTPNYPIPFTTYNHYPQYEYNYNYLNMDNSGACFHYDTNAYPTEYHPLEYYGNQFQHYETNNWQSNITDQNNF